MGKVEYTEERTKLIYEMLHHIYFQAEGTKGITFYHYTNTETLPYILRKDGIYLRFSKVDRLNDKFEGKEIMFFFHKAVEELKIEKKNDSAFILYLSEIEDCTPQSEFRFYIFEKNGLCDTVPPMKPYDQYVCCFSKNPDSVDIWRSYSKDSNGCGCRIEFSDNIVDENNEQIAADPYEVERFSFARVIYNNTEKVRKLKENIEWYYTNKDDIICKNLPLLTSKQYVETMLFAAKLVFKHECFESEDEIRIIYTYPRFTPEEKLTMGEEKLTMGKESQKVQSPEVKCRMKDGIAIPYFDYKMATNSTNSTSIPVRSIELSPLYPLEKTEAIQNIRDCLSVQGYDKYKIKMTKSQLPLRYY